MPKQLHGLVEAEVSSVMTDLILDGYCNDVSKTSGSGAFCEETKFSSSVTLTQLKFILNKKYLIKGQKSQKATI